MVMDGEYFVLREEIYEIIVIEIDGGFCYIACSFF